MRLNTMKAQCFELLDKLPKAKVQTLMIETGVTKGTGYCYKSEHKQTREMEAQRKQRH